VLQREQLRDHEERVLRLEAELEEHRKSPPEKGSKSLVVQNYKEKEAYLNFEVRGACCLSPFCHEFVAILK
jgi:PH/SEC7 domain-containing protein